jgi:hypothetical protein
VTPVLGLFFRLRGDVVRSVRQSVEPLTREGDDAGTYDDAEEQEELGGEFVEGEEEGGEEDEEGGEEDEEDYEGEEDNC